MQNSKKVICSLLPYIRNLDATGMHMKHLKRLCNFLFGRVTQRVASFHFACRGTAMPRPHDSGITKRAQHAAPLLVLIVFISLVFAAEPPVALTDAQKQWLDVVHWIISDYERNA